MRIFLSVSYSAEIGPDGSVNPAYRANLEAVITPLEAAGHTVFCAPRADNWRINDHNPSEAFKLDEKTLKKSDLVITFIGSSVSAGQQFELGLAFAHDKQIILAHEASVDLPFINKGLMGEQQVSELIYEDIKSCGDLILRHL
jgi:hypothetical protein